MQLTIYNLFIALYIGAARLLASWQPKAKRLIDGRKNLLQTIEKDFKGGKKEKVIWFHCASLGEFEQGRPLMEALKKENQNIKILLTFFSPSGYEVRKNYAGADYIYYLPFDTASNAAQFLAITQPDFAIFVKYELWYHYLKTLQEKAIPTILISAIFQERHAFFKWYGAIQRKMLHLLQHIFVQNEQSIVLLESIQVENVSIAGDTRIDRAVTIAATEKAYPKLESFKGNSTLIIAGSTWLDDENLLLQTLQTLQKENVKLLIAPHEIDAAHIQKIATLFKNYHPTLYSDDASQSDSKVLIMDNIGHLSFIYRYADIVWIGGGFNKTGIHNSIEAAVYNKAMCWGPRFQRYQEALDLVASGAAFSFTDGMAFANQISQWMQQKDQKEKAEQAAQQYILSNQGATAKIVDYLKQQRIF